MTHRTGFEETIKEFLVTSPDELRPISEYLREHMPKRLFAPGTIPAYSNYVKQHWQPILWSAFLVKILMSTFKNIC